MISEENPHKDKNIVLESYLFPKQVNQACMFDCSMVY